MRPYKAIVWVRDEPGERVSLLAESPDQAKQELRARYGEDIVITLWNEEDAARPR